MSPVRVPTCRGVPVLLSAVSGCSQQVMISRPTQPLRRRAASHYLRGVYACVLFGVCGHFCGCGCTVCPPARCMQLMLA